MRVFAEKEALEKANFSKQGDAGIAQLVERNLAKVEVASSSLVSRSKYQERKLRLPFFSLADLCGVLSINSDATFGLCVSWRGSKAVMHRIANPCRSVRLRPAPPDSPSVRGFKRLSGSIPSGAFFIGGP
jgi:hypothetical protein